MTQEKLPLREKLAYGCGDFASVLYWQTFMRYLPFFYTDIFGISAAALGTMLLVSRIWDGFNDPLIGMWADRTETRWGKFRPFILFGALPFALFGVLTFTTPDFGPAGKLIWAYLTYNALMMLYTTVNIPYTALLGVTTNNTVERTRLSSVKFIFAFSAGMVISFSLLRVVRWFGGADNPQLGWQLAFVVVGIVAIGFLLITFFGTKERIKPAHDPNTSMWKDVGFLVRNKAWLLLTATTLTWILFIAVRSSVSAHYFKYFIFNGDPESPIQFMGQSYTLDGLLSDFNGYGQAASVVGVLLTGFLASRISKRPLFVTLFIGQIASHASYVFLSADNIPAIFIIEIVGSMVGAPLPVLLWAMYADTADYGEWKTGRRTTGLVFSASTMSQKIGWALAAFFAFQILEYVGFKANVVPSLQVQNSLVYLMSVLPAAFGVLSLIIFLFYPLNDRKVNELNEELRERRIKAGLPTEA